MTDRAIPSRLAPTPGPLDLRYRPTWHVDRPIVIGARVEVDGRHAKQAVLDRATRDATRWTRYAPPGFRLACSIGVRSLTAPGFVAIVRQALHESALAPSALVLTIEPGDLMDLAALFEVIDDLRTLGLGVGTDVPVGPVDRRSPLLTADEFKTLLSQPTPDRSPGAKVQTAH